MSKIRKNPMSKTALTKAYIKGSRIPASFLFDYIKEGYSLSDFLSAYPWIKKSNVIKTLDEIKETASSRYAF